MGFPASQRICRRILLLISNINGGTFMTMTPTYLNDNPAFRRSIPESTAKRNLHREEAKAFLKILRSDFLNPSEFLCVLRGEKGFAVRPFLKGRPR
jgi:hypothetical protein